MAQQSRLTFAEWLVDGAALNAKEPAEGGILSVSHTENVDTRFHEYAMLGPLVNTVDCSDAGGTTANANGAALSHGMNATAYLFVIRGTKWAKVQMSNFSLVSDGSESALSEKATDILYTESSDGTEEISIGMAGTAYRVITAVSGTATDTHSANNDGQVCRVFGRMGGEASKPRIAGGNGQQILQNTLEGSTTMDVPSWNIRATLPAAITPTSIALDGTFWIIGTNEGPYYLNNDFQTFTPLIPEIGEDDDNCRVQKEYTFMGLLQGLATGTRVQQSVTSGQSVGPEVYETNVSPIQGRMTGFAATERWGYMAIRNEVDNDVYICAVRPRQFGAWHNNPMSFYPIIKLSATESEFLAFTDKAGIDATTQTDIAIDGSHSSGSDNATSSLAVSHTVGAGVDLLAVTVETRNGPVTAVDFDGDALTKAVAEENAGIEASVWYLVSPTAKTANVNVTTTGSSDGIVAGATNLTGVDTADPVRSTGVDGGWVTSSSIDLSSQAGDLAIDALAGPDDGSGTAPSVGSDQTQQHRILETETRGASSSEESTGSETTMSWSTLREENWRHAAVVFKHLAPNRTNPTMVGGHDSDIFWFSLGRIAQEFLDTNYQFASSGTWYGTIMTRNRRDDKWPTFIELETEDCDANKTVTVKLKADNRDPVRCGAAISTNGLQRVKVPSRLHGRRLQPILEFETDDSSVSPKVRGGLRMLYRLERSEVDNDTYDEVR